MPDIVFDGNLKYADGRSNFTVGNSGTYFVYTGGRHAGFYDGLLVSKGPPVSFTVSGSPYSLPAWTTKEVASKMKAYFDFSFLPGAVDDNITTVTQNNMTLNGSATIRPMGNNNFKSLHRRNTSQVLTATTPLGITGASPRTMFCVFMIYEPGHNSNMMALGGQAAGRQAMDIWFQSSYWAWHINGPAGNNGGYPSGYGAANIGAFAYTGSSSDQMQLWLNGNFGSKGITTGTAINTADGPLRLLSGVHTGLDAPSAQQYIGIGEVWVSDQYLTDAEQRSFEGYLAHKWGLVQGLPSNHPYKSSPPVGTAAASGTPTPTPTPTGKVAQHSYWV